MRFLLYLLLLLSGTGFVVSAFIHIAMLLGFPMPSLAIGLHLVSMIATVPAIAICLARTPPERRTGLQRHWEMIKAATRACPHWLKALVVFLSLYSLLDLTVLFFRCFVVRQAIQGGVEIFACHWMAIHTLAFAAYLSALRIGVKGAMPMCSCGADLRFEMDSCLICGMRIEDVLPAEPAASANLTSGVRT